jgi:PAS domain S-box-containing protein
MNMSEEAPPEGTLIISPLGTIEDADDAVCALLGYSKDVLLGLHGSDLIPQERRPAVAVALDRIRRGDLTFVTSGLVMHKSGSLLTVEVSARRLPNNRLALHLRLQSAGS